MKKQAYLLVLKAVLLSTIVTIASSSVSFAQCNPAIKIDGAITVLDSDLKLPLWLKEGQQIAIASNVHSISIIEFTVNGTSLEFSQIHSVVPGPAQSVPSGKAWKVESVLKASDTSTYRNTIYSNPGTYTFVVPGCAEQICVEAWGGGGGGGGGSQHTGSTPAKMASGGGGGGGGFGSECFAVTPGSQLTVVVGSGGASGAAMSGSSGGTGQSGGAGGNSSVGSSILALGGGAGGGAMTNTSTGTGGTAGAAGTSAAASNAPGVGGGAGVFYLWQSPFIDQPRGNGGAAGNGGAGGSGSSSHGQPGTLVGGGGGGGGRSNGNGGAGANGKVIITW